jgi:hypothetical protein
MVLFPGACSGIKGTGLAPGFIPINFWAFAPIAIGIVAKVMFLEFF